MKVLFINPGKEMAGVQCLSAFVKQDGHRTALVNDPKIFYESRYQMRELARYFDRTDELLEQAAAHNPDVVGISVVSDDFRWALAWARRIKERIGVPVVFGNIHATTASREVLAHPEVDFVVRGEGELTFLELLGALGKKRGYEKVLGIGYRDHGTARLNTMRAPIEDLDILPYPDKDLYYEQMPYLNAGYTTITGRGCPYRCTYCDNNTSQEIYRADGFTGRWPRRHSPEYTVREIEWARERYGIDHVLFNDEEWTYSRRWLMEFCEIYKERLRIPFFAWGFPNTVDDEVARVMADAGCDSMQMGIEAGSDELRKKVLQRRTSDENCVRAMQACRKAGIRLTVDMILGLPNETKEDLDAAVRMMNEGQPWHLYCFWLRYYPNTAILRLAREHGFVDDEFVKEVARGSHETGVVTGGHAFSTANDLTRSYHTFLLLIPVLPKRFVSWMSRRDWPKLFPKLPAAIVHNITKLLKPNPRDQRKRHELGYWKMEFPLGLRRAFARFRGKSAMLGAEEWDRLHDVAPSRTVLTAPEPSDVEAA